MIGNFVLSRLFLYSFGMMSTYFNPFVYATLESCKLPRIINKKFGILAFSGRTGTYAFINCR